MGAQTQYAENLPGPLIEAFHRRGAETFRRLGLPSKKDERWRFTPLDRLGDLEGVPLSPGSCELENLILKDYYHLVFHNGQLDENSSDFASLPPGCRILPIEEVHSGGEVGHILGSILPPEAGAYQALNTSRFDHGVWITLAEGSRLDKPIHILHHCDTAGAALYPRNLIIAGPGASGTIVEHFVSKAPLLRMPLSEIHLGPEAELRLTRLQEEHEDGRHLGFVGAQLEEHSRLELMSLGMGAGFFRLELEAALKGEGASANLSGLQLGHGTGHGEHLVRVDHQAPDCSSHQLFRSILNDQSRGVFTGRIVVAPKAQGTDANQSSKSLLLSERATAQNNPQLEIDADDVRCTHGSTVGELDPEALFYLRARGIGAEEARALLTHAFAAEVIQAIPIEELRTRLEEMLITRFLKPDAS